ncbi:hypothetical protein MAGR_15660 [Mycolicibacterium agri]|uniref:Uncharacterized protein n=1 Tax=Mycolicibacterium agri TaxID=36811 RepID=A0A7I9VXC4_MYCAG|nr:hypothetical protein MAGR_15660 [Mycolicibacterium agri]
MTTTHRGATDPIGADLLRLLKTLKLGRWPTPCPNAPPWPANTNSAIGFLETLLADEVLPTRVPLRRTAGDQSRTRPHHAVRHLTAHEDLRYDRTLLGDLTSLRFLDAASPRSSSVPSA